MELLREFGHFRAASWANRAHHVAAFSGFFHRCLLIRHSFLLLTFHTIHFSQSMFPPLLYQVRLPHGEAIKGFATVCSGTL